MSDEEFDEEAYKEYENELYHADTRYFDFEILRSDYGFCHLF